MSLDQQQAIILGHALGGALAAGQPPAMAGVSAVDALTAALKELTGRQASPPDAFNWVGRASYDAINEKNARLLEENARHQASIDGAAQDCKRAATECAEARRVASDQATALSLVSGALADAGLPVGTSLDFARQIRVLAKERDQAKSRLDRWVANTREVERAFGIDSPDGMTYAQAREFVEARVGAETELACISDVVTGARPAEDFEPAKGVLGAVIARRRVDATAPAAICTDCGTPLHANEVHCDDCGDALHEDGKSQDGTSGAAEKATDRPAHVVIDGNRGGVLVCQKCKEEYRPTLPAPSNVFQAMMTAFGRDHAHDGPAPAPFEQTEPSSFDVTALDGAGDRFEFGTRPRPPHWAATLLVQSLGDSITSVGAQNYVSFLCDHPTAGKIEVLIQRVEGKRPADLVTETRADLDLVLRIYRATCAGIDKVLPDDWQEQLVEHTSNLFTPEEGQRLIALVDDRRDGCSAGQRLDDGSQEGRSRDARRACRQREDALSAPHAVTLRRYYVPNEKGEGWGLFVIGSDGYFSVVSDYGHYAFRWSHPGCEFRRFLTQIDGDYCARKLVQGDLQEYQGGRTRKAVEARIVEMQNEQRLDKEEAEDEWELARQLEDDGLMGAARWHDATKLGDAGELIVYDLPADVRAFAARLLPRFQALLRAELAAEAAPEVEVVGG